MPHVSSVIRKACAFYRLFRITKLTPTIISAIIFYMMKSRISLINTPTQQNIDVISANFYSTKSIMKTFCYYPFFDSYMYSSSCTAKLSFTIIGFM